MNVRYLYSACVVIQTRDLALGCDPWFTPGIYDGAWFHYPPIVGDAVELLGRLDAIYVSHIDPDHYDSRFLKRYLSRYPGTDLFIGDTRPPYLLQSMKRDGFKPTVLTGKTFGRTEVHIFPNRAYETDNIDTALVLTRDGLSTANMNDNPYDQGQVDAVLSVCPERRPTFALLPYAGAGPYPQTYVFDREEAREVSAQKKKRQFLALYSRYVESLKPLRAMPFAGKYVLGGSLASLNEHRGLADATEALASHGDVSLVLADGGNAYFDLETLQASAVRTAPYDAGAMHSYIATLPFDGFDYEKELRPLGDRALPLMPLLRSAFEKAIQIRRVKEPYWFCFRPHGLPHYLAIEISSGAAVEALDDVSSLYPRCEIFIDQRYLFGLLTRLYNWTNAQIGSHFIARRVPDEYRRDAFAFLNKVHV